MASGDEPVTSSSNATSAPVASTSNTPLRQIPSPETEGDPESGFSREWMSNHEETVSRRQREIREATGNVQRAPPEYRTSPQQQAEMDDEEREY